MAGSQEEYWEREVVEEAAVDGGYEWGLGDGADREAVDEFVVGLAERESVLLDQMGRVFAGETDFKPFWMQDGAVGVGSVLEVVDVYVEKASGWTEDQKTFVARELSGVLVKPASDLLGGMEGAEEFRAGAETELEQARVAYEEAMLTGDSGKGLRARAMLNQVWRDSEGVSRGEEV